MKKIITIFLAVVVAFPIFAFATEPEIPTNSDPTTVLSTFDIKAYGNQFADYSTGYLDIQSTTQTTSYGNSKEWTAFNNAVGTIDPCEGSNCGMLITQGSFTETNFDTETTTKLTGRNLTGYADMTSMGGLAACTTGDFDIPVSGSYYQTQKVSNLVSGTLTPGLTGSSSYCGVQTIKLNIGPTP